MTIPKKWKTKRTSNGSGCIEIGQGDKERRIKGKTRGGHIEYMRGSKKNGQGKIEGTRKKDDKRRSSCYWEGEEVLLGEEQMKRKKTVGKGEKRKRKGEIHRKETEV